MTRYKSSIVAALSLAGLAAVPVIANAHHQPGHQGGGGTSSLGVSAAPNPVVFGRRTAVSGRLTGPNNAGRTITIDGAPFPFTSYRLGLATAVTNSQGQFLFKRKPGPHTRYRVRTPGVGSAAVTVLVRKRVSLYLSDYTPRRGQVVRFSGRACPKHDGVRVGIQKRQRDGSWRSIRHTVLDKARRCSVYSKRLRIFTDGTFRTIVAADPDHARGFSRRRSVDAHR